MSLPRVLPEVDRAVLEARVAAGRTAQRDALWAKIILGMGQASDRVAAKVLGCSRTTVRTWRARYQAQGLAGLMDRPRSGAPRTYDDAQRRELAAAATSTPPPPFVRWTHARLAEQLRERPPALEPGAAGVARPGRGWAGHCVISTSGCIRCAGGCTASPTPLR